MSEGKWKTNYLGTLFNILNKVLFKHFFWYIVISTVFYTFMTRDFNFPIDSNTFYAIMTFFLIKNVAQGLLFYIRHPAKYQIITKDET